MTNKKEFKWVRDEERDKEVHKYIHDAVCWKARGMYGNQLVAIYSVDDGREHLSVSCNQRNPMWEEITAARDRFLKPNGFYVMCLPPKKYYVNLHKHAFHLWQTFDGRLQQIMKGM